MNISALAHLQFACLREEVIQNRAQSLFGAYQAAANYHPMTECLRIVELEFAENFAGLISVLTAVESPKL